MKTRGLKIGRLVPAMMLLFSLTFLAAPKTTNAQAQISFQMFYDQLSPHGQWFQDPEYGYVWSPNVGNDFRPYYSNGYWAMTQYGNMWMSDYSWGWAPFHYGRWTLNPRFGWIWVPGMEWGPAWVSWRHGAGNYGWAPMGPGISVNMSFGNNYYTPHDWWIFIPMNYIHHRNFHRYYAPRNTYNIYNRTTIINNTYVDRGSRTTYVTGPRRNDIERATRSRVEVYNVGTRRDAGRSDISGRNVNVYRPRVTDNGARGSASPRNATRMDNSIVTTPTRETNSRNNAVTPNRSNQTERNVTPNRSNPTERNATPNRNTQTERNVTPIRSNQTERNVTPAQPQRQNNVERSSTPNIQNREDVNRNRQQQRATPPNNRSNAQPQRSNTVQPQKSSTQPQRSSSVQQSRSSSVQQNRSSSVQQNRSSSVQQNRSSSVQQSRSSSVQQSRSSSVQQNRSSSVQQNRSSSVQQNRSAQPSRSSSISGGSSQSSRSSGTSSRSSSSGSESRGR